MSGYDDYYNSFYRELAEIDARSNSLRKIEDVLPSLQPGGRVLDIGCGHGSVSGELVEKGLCVHGMEINAEALDSLRRRGIVPIEHDIARPFPTLEPYDLVMVLDVLEHVFDPAGLLAEATRCVAPGGAMIISVPLYFDLLDRLRILFTGSVVSYDNRCYGKALHRRFRSYNYDHIRFFRPQEMLELCRLAGLRVEEVRYRPLSAGAYGKGAAALTALIANRWTVKWFPGLLAHAMVVRVTR